MTLLAWLSSKGALPVAAIAAALLLTTSRGWAVRPLLALLLGGSWTAQLRELKGKPASDSCDSPASDTASSTPSSLSTPREGSEPAHWRPNRQAGSLNVAAAAGTAGGAGAPAAAADAAARAAPPSPKFKAAALLAYARLDDGGAS